MTARIASSPGIVNVATVGFLVLAMAACSQTTPPEGTKSRSRSPGALVTIAPGDNTLVTGLGGPAGFGEIDLTTTPQTGGGSDDGFWLVDLSAVFPNGIDFFGTRYDPTSQIFVGTNGYITFREGMYGYDPLGISYSMVPIVASFFADQDFTDRGSGNPGKAWLDLDTTASDPVVTLSYIDVPRYPANDFSILNSYQIRLHKVGSDPVNGDKVAMEFRYNKIQWLDGDASLGTFATAGWSDGNSDGSTPTQVFSEVVGSGTAAMANNATGDLAYSNLASPQAGIYAWVPLFISAEALSSGQSALPGREFAQPLIVEVVDGNGVPVEGATVKFAPPTSGPRASVEKLAVTDVDGRAQAIAWAGIETGTYEVKAFVSQGGYSVPVSFTLTNLFEPPLATLLNEGFESGLGGFVPETTSGIVSWITVTNPETLAVTSELNPVAVTLPDAGYHLPAAGGSNVAWFGELSTGSYIGSDFPRPANPKGGGSSADTQAGTLTSPAVDLTGYTAATLEFDSWWEIEGVAGSWYDIMTVQVSTDGGGSWNDLGVLNPTIPTNAPSDTGFTAGGSSAPPVWRHYVYDLSSVAGSSVFIRFQFDTGDSAYNGFRGWTIDNVVVQGGSEVPAPYVSSLDPPLATQDDLVTVTGANFAQGAQFYIGTTLVGTVTILGSSTAIIVVPGGLTDGRYDVTVVNPDGKLNIAPDIFTYSSAPSPVVDSIDPIQADPWSSQTIYVYGTNFVDGAEVTFGSNYADWTTFIDEFTLEVGAPGLDVGTYNVKVVNPGGQSGTLYGAYAVGTGVVPGISISAPWSGAAWTLGNSEYIEWSSAGVNWVTIELWYDGTYDSTLATGVTASDGWWFWDIPTSLSAGIYYTIQIVDEDGIAPTAESAYFSLGGATSSTATLLEVSSVAPEYGTSVTFTATVTSGGSPIGAGGAVELWDGATLLDTAFTNELGVATFTSSSLPVGTYGFWASYLGDASFDPSSSGSVTVEVVKATAIVNLASLAQTYDGTARVATATTVPSGLTVTFTYDGGATAPTNAGTYAVVGTVVDSNYQGTASGSLVVGKATGTVNLASLAQTYSGTARVATATTVPSGLTVTFTYDGSATAPTNAGTYAVVGTIVDSNYQGTASGSLVVGKATATVNLASLAQTYDGTARVATATTVPSGLTVTFTYDGGATAPTNAGTYAVVGTVVDSNYQGTASGSLVVGKATGTVNLASLAQTYNGSPRVATATTVPSGLTVTFTYDAGATAPTNAGTYAVVGTVVDSNYQGTASGSLVVGKATATVNLASLAQTYDGSPRVATATTVPSGLTVTFTYDGGATAPTNAGTYAVVGTIVDSNYQGTASGSLVVGKATATVNLASLAQTYSGTARVATATTVPSGLTVTFTYDGGATAPTNAGTYAVVGTVVDSNYQGTASGSLVVGKATGTVNLASLAQTYSGTARVATATTVPSGLTVTFTYDGSATAPTNAGTYAVVGTIVDSNYQGTASGSLVVGKATATVNLAGLAQTYDGTARIATATTVPSGLTVTFTYDAGATAPTNAGTYAVVGTVVDSNYQGTASGSLVVGKATATVNLASLAQTYDGSPRVATATTVPSGLTVTFTYDGGATAPTNAGTYAVVGTIVDSNYQGTASGSLVVGKATATVNLASLAQTYNGSPRVATATTEPTGLTVTFTYDGGATAPTNAGTYAVVGTIVDANYQGTASGSLVVGKATATVNLAGLAQTYDGTARVATATTEPTGLTVTFTYDGGATAPTNAGTYAVVGTIVDSNYQGTASGSLVVGKATAPITLAGLAQTYDGTARVATATTEPTGLTVTFTYDGGATAPTNAGTYAVVGTIVDSNYQGTASGSLVVGKATATVNLAGLAQTYNGSPRVATATTEPTGLTVTFTYDGGATAPTNAGTYAVVGTIVDSNYQGTASGSLVVGKATATVNLAGLAQTYNGSPRVATATTEPTGLTVTFTYDGGATAPTNAGTYAVVGTIVDSNYQGTASGSLVVGKATATVNLASLAQTYNGSPRVATATTEPTGLTVTFTYDGGATAPTNAGTYAVVGTIVDANYQGTASGSLVVGKATATVNLAGLAQTYDGTARVATATTEPTGLTVTFTYDGGATAPTNAGTYAVVGTIVDSNYQGTASGSLVVGKATAPITLAGLAQTYDGTARVATATTEPTGLTVTFTYDGGATAPTNAGTYAVVGTIVDSNYQGTASGSLVVGKANQAIAFTPPTTMSFGDAALDLAPLAAGGSSGNPVSFALTSGPATLAGAMLTATGAGTVVVTASQAGSANYLAAADAPATITVGKASTAVALASNRPAAKVNQPITFTATVTASGSAGTPTGMVTFRDDGTSLGTGSLTSGVAALTVPSLAKGTHVITAEYEGATNYLTATGTLAGGQVVPESAPVAGSGTAVAFDGATQHAGVSDPTGALDSARTVELWFSALSGSGAACLVQIGDELSLRIGVCLSAARDGLEVRRGVEVTPVATTITAGWHHLALVEEDDGSTTLLLDGTALASLTGGFETGTAQPVVFGAALASGVVVDHFAGQLDELRLWSTARTAAQLDAAAREPVAGDAAGLLALWRMDEGDGASLYDAGPSHLEATLTGAGDGTFLASTAWTHRVTNDARELLPFLTGYDPDGDPIVVTVVTAPSSGDTTAAGTSLGYTARGQFFGTDAFTYQVESGGLTSQFTTEVEVIRPATCEVQADCVGGDVCANGLCMRAEALTGGAGGCGCGQASSGETTALLALLVLVFLPRRRAVAQDQR